MGKVNIKGIALLVWVVLIWGCGKVNTEAPILDGSGKHAANWIVDHRAAFVRNPGQCTGCHGDDQRGGISQVSCSTPLQNGQACHAGGPSSSHPTGWRDPALHSEAAKKQPGASSGFVFCQRCHGADFAGGFTGVSCFTAGRDSGACHVTNGVPIGAPHSPIPWRTYPSPTHTKTVDDPAGLNAATCALCHLEGRNLRTQILTTFATGQPGCFNATLCHGQIGHPLTGWRDPAFHGEAAKKQPGASSGFTSCQGCHGADFAGGFTGVSCFTAGRDSGACHVTNGVPIGAPHSPIPWRTYPSPTHTKTVDDPAGLNAATCALCHLEGRNLRTQILTTFATGQPGCFNATLCHGQIGHPLTGWRDPAFHGEAAKTQSGASSGFVFCQRCHGADFAGGLTKVSCFTAGRDSGACHVTNGVPIGAPHSPIPWRTYPSPTHTDTVDDPAGLSAATCALCHLEGRNLRTQILTTFAAGQPGCFNTTLCHGTMGHPLNWAEPANHGSAGKANLTFCQQCHADVPLGGPGSNPRFNVLLGRLADAGRTGCEVCHAPFAAHPRVLQIPVAFGAISRLNPLNTPWYLHCKASPAGFAACNRCHGANLDGVGGVVGATACTSCHRSGLPTTLLNCTSCHSRPPNGSVYPNIASAHPRHNALNATDICGECHYGQGSVSLDHFLRAKNGTTSFQTGAVQFGAFAQTGGVNPLFNETTQQCSNTYCHGATLVGGANKTPLWNDPAYLAAAGCGTCHGFPPGNAAHTGFTASTPCVNCHLHVNTTNSGFSDPTKHVNGAIDVVAGAPHAFPNPGAVHGATAGGAPFPGCVTAGCHTNGAAVGGYPVAVGTPPDCRGCHTKAAPGNSCGACHGVASGSVLTAGRPNGSTFPDIAGRHVNPHSSFACALCHGANGTGSSNHGPSNRIAHGDADVNIQFTGEAAAMNFTRNVPGNGHGNCSGSCHGRNHGDSW